MTSTSDLVAACSGFLDDALQGRLSHTGQPVLRDAAASAVKKDLPAGGFAWNRAGSSAQLMAATLAHYALLTFGPLARRETPLPLAVTPRRDRSDDEFDRALGAPRDVMTMPF